MENWGPEKLKNTHIKTCAVSNMGTEEKRKFKVRFSTSKIFFLLFYCFILHSQCLMLCTKCLMLYLLKCPPSQINDFLYFLSVDFGFVSHPKLSKNKVIWLEQKLCSFICGLLNLKSRLCHCHCLILFKPFQHQQWKKIIFYYY